MPVFTTPRSKNILMATRTSSSNTFWHNNSINSNIGGGLDVTRTPTDAFKSLVLMASFEDTKSIHTMKEKDNIIECSPSAVHNYRKWEPQTNIIFPEIFSNCLYSGLDHLPVNMSRYNKKCSDCSHTCTL
jgi:hypothetical protein